jgi:hypothetical protein
MGKNLRSRSVVGTALWVCLSAAVLAEPAEAAWVGFRNDTTAILHIQPAIIVNNAILKGRQIVLLPGQMSWELLPAGPGRLTILDARQPVRILYDENIIIGNIDVFFSLQLDVQVLPGGMQAPRVKLVPARPPAPPPRPGILLPQPVPPKGKK